MTICSSARDLRVLMLSPFSRRYPSIGETHALSVLAACVRQKFGSALDRLDVLDLVGYGDLSDQEIVARIRDSAPTVLCISAAYGTYDRLKELYPRVLSSISCVNPLVVFGGALPSYLPARILEEIEPRAVVVIGEGDEALPRIIEAWRCGGALEDIPNTCRLENGSPKFSGRALVNLSLVPRPFRDHTAQLASSGAQIFTEASRGCSWAACSFCLRGLTDVEGVRTEFRRFPIQRVLDDILELRSQGIQAVTFADEDFLGGDTENLVVLMDTVKESTQGKVKFDVSMTVHSACMAGKADVIRRLKEAGLRKVFLGIESGSASQLRRYAKGHSPEQAGEAAALVLGAGLELEIGFILFDPLVTLDEIIEDLEFLLGRGLAKFVSGLVNELRLQVGSRYLTRLRRAEEVNGVILHSDQVDPNTLCHAYQYLHASSDLFVSLIRECNRTVERLHYPLKSLSRYGTGGILGSHVNEVRSLVAELREEYARILLGEAMKMRSGKEPDGDFAVLLRGLLSHTAKKAVSALTSLSPLAHRNSIVANVLEVAQGLAK
jgi:hypothetical protein